MKHLKKITALSLSVLLLNTLVIPTYAESAPTEKQEVIYVLADNSGKAKDIEVVNIFDGGDITDYGDYSTVKMLNTTDKIKQDGDKIGISSSADKVYYQGKLKSVLIPWNISIHYYLDGKEYNASELAGKSGALEIHFSVSKSDGYSGDFYENYALQANFMLDSDKCSNIIADGATIANVGENKQITYTILPGKGIESVIKANVTDFEMDAIEINGIRLNLNVDIDDAELMNKVTELMDATKKLNDGASTLADGTNTLKDGANSLLTGTENLGSGVSTLDSGVATLQNGVNTMQEALDTLNSKSSALTSGSAEMKKALETLQSNLNAVSASTDQLVLLTQSSVAIKQGINDLYDGVSNLHNNLGYAQYKAIMNQNGLDIDNLKAGNTAAIENLNSQILSLQATLSQLKDVPGQEEQVQKLQQQISSLQNVTTLLGGNNAAINGTEAYLNTVSDGVHTLHDGVEELKTKYTEFDAAISAFADTLSDMLVKMSALSDGVNTLVAKYTELDNGITEYTNGVAKIVSSYSKIVDGVSSLAQGSKKLVNGAETLNAGASNLYNGVESLNDGAYKLANGTSKLYSNTDGMDTQVQEKIDEILSSIGGDKTKPVSFVSDKNANVSSVQFVIKTDTIKKSEAASTEVHQNEKLNFWQKLLHLFGVN
ncbi:hypothetical protein [Enterococcus cecorum]|uniref:hypothetical protein n=1 Tax=Enterococcus cecorum TaxID=44008 RepID=UPI001FAE6DD7|nr:hypothetical protein [Enterococcus cecorum]MCJ0564810.1 hypothetical protein [Enterococcus cecorum]